MKRLLLVTVAVVLLVLTAMVLPGCSSQTPVASPEKTPTAAPIAEKPIELRYASFIPEMDVFAQVPGEWAKELEAATNGRIKVTFYHSESLVKMPDLFDAVAAGTADFAMIDALLTPERLSLSGGITLPMLFKSASQSQQTMWSLLEKYEVFRKQYEPTKVVWCHNPSTGQLVGNKPMEKKADLANQKVAIVIPSEAESTRMLGMTPVSTIPTEMYTLLERGVVDAAVGDFNQAFIWKLFEITKYRTGNIDLSVKISPVIMNMKTYEDLPEDLKPIFDEVTDGLKMSQRAGAAYDEFMANSIKIIKEYDAAKGNPDFYMLPDAERQLWYETLLPMREKWISDMEAKGLPGKAFMDDLIAFAEQYK